MCRGSAPDRGSPAGGWDCRGREFYELFRTAFAAWFMSRGELFRKKPVEQSQRTNSSRTPTSRRPVSPVLCQRCELIRNPRQADDGERSRTDCLNRSIGGLALLCGAVIVAYARSPALWARKGRRGPSRTRDETHRNGIETRSKGPVRRRKGSILRPRFELRVI